MQFSNGFWLMKKGYQCFSPAEVYFTKMEKECVTITAPTKKIVSRGDTLQGVNLTIKLTAPMPEVIRVSVCHHKGVKQRGPKFELNLSETGCMEAEEDSSKVKVTSGSLCVTVCKETCSMTFERSGEIIAKTGPKDLAYIRGEWQGDAYAEAGQPAYMRQQLSLSVGELVYGLGEHFTALVKNGQSLDMWNEDGGTSTQQSYKNIPFYLSNRGYGVFVNHTEKVSFEAATEHVARMEFSVGGEELDYFFINGPSMKEALVRYTDLTGKPSLPPAWTFGLWLSTSFTTDYDEKTVMSFIEGMQERGIPLRVFHFDCFWMKEFHWSDFLWDERVFPDPEGMLARIKEKGLNVCVWINPYIAQESRLFDEGMERGYLLKRKNGDVWQWDMWQPGMAVVDFTNPDARKWFSEKLEILLDMGVDCFKTDFGERIPVDVEYFDHSDPVKMHNYYTYLYNQTVFELLEKKRGKGNAVLFARSATAGGQKFPVHWGGDCWSDYEAMEQSLRGGLSLTMSGFGYWSHDIGGFEDTSTPDVYKRWAAFGLLSSHSRLHGSTSYRVPWIYDDEAVEVVGKFTRLKNRLMPYLFTQAVTTSRTGVPMMRAMVLEYTQDRNCSYLDKQYMLGDSLLVAPVFNEQSRAEYYLPEGRWTNLLTGEVKEGRTWYEEYQDYKSIPLYVRENTILPFGSCEEKPDYDYLENLELRIYLIQEDAETKQTVYSQDGIPVLTVSLTRTGREIKIELSKEQEVMLRFVNQKLSQVSGGVLTIDGMDNILNISDKVTKVYLEEEACSL